MGDAPAQVQHRLAELAGDDHPFADWSAYLLPESIRGMGDPEMTLHTRASADALVEAGANSLCVRCGAAASSAVGEVPL
jgi:hypothetical protein